MRASYIGAKIINAEPCDEEGKPGYTVYYPGYTSWSPKHVFEEAYRPVSTGERELMLMTDGEASIARISDGDPDHVSDDCPSHDGRHHWEYRETSDDYKCFHCPAQQFTKPDQLG